MNQQNFMNHKVNSFFSISKVLSLPQCLIMLLNRNNKLQRLRGNTHFYVINWKNSESSYKEGEVVTGRGNGKSEMPEYSVFGFVLFFS